MKLNTYKNIQIPDLVKAIDVIVPSYYRKEYSLYANEFLTHVVSYNYRTVIPPQMLLKMFKDVFPKNTIFEPSFEKYGWPELISWVKRLKTTAQYIEEQLNNKPGIEYAKKHGKAVFKVSAKEMYAAADIISKSVVVLRGREYKATSMKLAWNWCPFCWRTVEDSNGNVICELHLTGSSEYKKRIHLLTKMKCPDKNGLGERLMDRMPMEQWSRTLKNTKLGFKAGFPKGWDFLPNTKKYLLEINQDIDLADIDACFEALSPRSLMRFKSSLFFEPEDLEILWLKETMLTRAEIWLAIELKYTKKWCGKRINAGRPNKRID